MGWTKQQDSALLTLFRTGKAPYEPANGSSITAAVIKQVWEVNPILQTNYKIRSFYPLYRRKAAEFLCDQTKSGSRRKYIFFIFFSANLTT